MTNSLNVIIAAKIENSLSLRKHTIEASAILQYDLYLLGVLLCCRREARAISLRCNQALSSQDFRIVG